MGKKPEFRLWLRSASNSYKVNCEKCDVTITAELTVIRKHGDSDHHKERMADIQINIQKTLDNFVAPVDDSVHCAEIRLSGFAAAHNIVFNLMDHLCETLKSIFPDSKIAQSLHTKRTKSTAIVKNVIGDFQKEQLAEKLKNVLFGILTDDSTDIGGVKSSCIVVRFYDKDAGIVISRFWDLVQVFGNEEPVSENPNDSFDIEYEKASAEHLFTLIIESFDKHTIPYENMVAYGSDGCNTMMGDHNSVKTRFQKLCPGITITKCVSHSLHLCASEACKKLPRDCEDLARNIYGHLKSSSKKAKSPS